MILTGKSKEDFIKWYYSKCNKQPFFQDYSLDLANVILNALIIEWFDNIGVGIDAYTQLSKENKLYWSADIIAEFDIKKDSATIGLYLNCKTRQEATTEAIKKANEIYNEKQGL